MAQYVIMHFDSDVLNFRTKDTKSYKLNFTIMKNFYKMTRMVSVLLILFVLAITAGAQPVVYVSPDGAGDGTSWATAAGSIQDAIQAASEGTEIWIKGGTYYVPGDSTFILKDGVSLYGGFAGTETSPIQRTDYRRGGANETILSGDIDKNGVTDEDNANRVMYGLDITEATTLDGLTITGGYAVDSDDGGGLRLSNGSPNVINCTLFDNFCADNGAGMYIATTSNPDITGCYFIKNFAEDKGGGIYTATDCNAVFTNCVFSNNTATNNGPAVRVYRGSPTFINCTFTRNALPASGDGSAVEINNSLSSPEFMNCVFWGNTEAGTVGEDITLTTDGTVTISTCALEGTYTATGATVSGLLDISTTDPLFVNTAGSSGTEGYDASADWDIQTGSVLINAGLTNGAPEMDITPEFRDATPDIGAYEYEATVPFIIASAVTGSGSVEPRGAYVKPGEAQLFVIAPTEGYELKAATYNGTDILASLTDNGDGSFSYTVSSVAADGLLAVTFEALAVEYTVTVSAGAGGSIAPSGDIKVLVTDETVFTITPDASFEIDDLLLNDESVKESLVDNLDGTFSYTLTNVGKNSTLTVSFLELFTVTLSAGANGSIDPSGTIEMTVKDEQVVTITPNNGYLIDACTLGGTDIKGELTDNGDASFSYTLTGVNADVTLSVTFVKIQVEVVYIKEGGTGNGSSWANAAGDIQATIDGGELGREIWVAKGTYIVPTDTSFVLKNGVSLYGGFAGTESSKDQRSQFRKGEANETILTADVDGNGFLTGGNAPRVIFGEFISPQTTIDGFTINGGYSDVEDSNGAGIKLRASSPNILNCTFFDNFCDDGPHMYLYRSEDIVSSPLVMNCYFIKGYANDDGGAVYNASGTRAQFVNCVFANNFASDEGGAVRNFECSPAFINCDFVYNELPDADPGGGGTYGAAIRNYQGSSDPYMNTEPDIINCVFWKNKDGDAALNYEVSNTGNMASAGANARVINCALMDTLSSSVIIENYLNISTDNPGFADVTGEPGYLGYRAASNWRLVEGSVLIAQGKLNEPGVPTHDMDGKRRGALIDIGAFEFEAAIGIRDRLSEQSFAMDVYPNPSEGSFRVKVDKGSVQEVLLIDLTGRVVFRNTNPGFGSECIIDTGDQTGVFLLRVTKDNGQINTSKVIVR